MALLLEGYRRRVCDALRTAGGGSFLRGWRVEFDPTGALEVNFLDFCRAASRLRLHEIDVALLFGEDSPNEMTLDELDPVMGDLIGRFRNWITVRFGGPSEMFTVLEAPDGEGKINREQFVEGILKDKFEADEEQVSEIFNLLDFSCVDRLDMEDVMFLDLDPKTREGAIRKMKMRPRIEHENMLAELHRHTKAAAYRDGHRLAVRGWHAPSIDKLPEVALERRKAWNQGEYARRKQTWSTFKMHLISTYGNGVRAWRKGLDPGDTFRLTRGCLWQYCRRLNLEFDCRLLWSILDRDCDGSLRMEEVAPHAASFLARFWKWAKTSFGGCQAAWPAIMKVARPPPSWKSISSLKHGTFLHAIQALGWRGAGGPMAGLHLCLGLDLDACGIIMRSDLTWLDGWNPPEWLYCLPNQDAWNQLSARLLRRYQNPLRAWRQLDQDDSNAASWDEFVSLCDRVGFRGDRGGAWRYLDRDISGTITMTEWHKESAVLLASFKEFLDKNYGSVKLCFERIDSDNSGSVTFSELKRACRRRGWSGDCLVLFKCLDISTQPGLRTLSYRDVAFLDTWEPSLDDEVLPPDEMHGDALELARRQMVAANASRSPEKSTFQSRSYPASGLNTELDSFLETGAIDGGNGSSILPSLSRPESAGSWNIPTPTLSELVADAFDKEELARAHEPSPTFGVGCLHADIVNHMKQELCKLTREKSSYEQQCKEISRRSRSTPQLRGARRPQTDPLPTVRRPITSGLLQPRRRRPKTTVVPGMHGKRPATTEHFPGPGSSVGDGLLLGGQDPTGQPDDQETFLLPPKVVTSQ